MCSIRKTSEEDKPGIDVREALFNLGEIGPIEHIQVSAERVTALRGILLDLDSGLYRKGPLTPAVPTDPHEFFSAVVGPWLTRHPVLDKAEVRCSGTGLHGILWFSEPLEFASAGQRDRWDGIIKVIQSALPTDPDAPAITAVTRPVGSINSKNGAPVEVLKPGAKVTVDEMESLFGELCSSPFKTVFRILTGSDRVSPCPICQKPGTTLSALDHIGHCYATCGQVQLEALYDIVFVPRGIPSKEAKENDEGNE